jgi:hypothetical protein
VSDIVSVSERGHDDGRDRHDASAIELLIPVHDVADPEVSIVVPAVNEKLTISEFVSWCQQGLRNAGASTARTTGPRNSHWRGERECFAHPNAGSDGLTSMRAPTFADDTS